MLRATVTASSGNVHQSSFRPLLAGAFAEAAPFAWRLNETAEKRLGTVIATTRRLARRRRTRPATKPSKAASRWPPAAALETPVEHRRLPRATPARNDLPLHAV